MAINTDWMDGLSVEVIGTELRLLSIEQRIALRDRLKQELAELEAKVAKTRSQMRKIDGIVADIRSRRR